jgi:hypothetical protein
MYLRGNGCRPLKDKNINANKQYTLHREQGLSS